MSFDKDHQAEEMNGREDRGIWQLIKKVGGFILKRKQTKNHKKNIKTLKKNLRVHLIVDKLWRPDTLSYLTGMKVRSSKAEVM